MPPLSPEERERFIVWLTQTYGQAGQTAIQQGTDLTEQYEYWVSLGSPTPQDTPSPTPPTTGFPPGVAGGLPTGVGEEEPLPTGFENAEVIIPGALLLAPDGSYYDYNTHPVNEETALKMIEVYNRSVEEPDPDGLGGISEYEQELVRLREAEMEQRRQEELSRLGGEAVERQRLTDEFGAGQQLQREQMLATEARDIRGFMLQRQQISAQLKAHPRNWLESLEFDTPGILPKPSSVGVNPQGGF